MDPSFEQAIQEHLELKRRGAALEHAMPLQTYLERAVVQAQPGEAVAQDPWLDGVWAEPPRFDWGE